MSVLDSMEGLLASCNDVLPSTLNAAQADLEYLRMAEQRAANWRRAELLQIVCALVSYEEDVAPEHEDRWVQRKISTARRLLDALDVAADVKP